MNTNPIPHAGLWVTPESYEDLQARVEACSSKWDAMMLTINLCHKTVADAMAEAEKSKADKIAELRGFKNHDEYLDFMYSVGKSV
jgi:hypothetical protein